MSRWRGLAGMGLLGIMASSPTYAGLADVTSDFLSGPPEPGPPGLSAATADEVRLRDFEAFGHAGGCVSNLTPDPDADGGNFPVPDMFCGVIDTDPVVVTAALDSPDGPLRSHMSGFRAAAGPEPPAEADDFLAGASSRPHEVAAMVISAGLCGLGWMRYRLYLQRRRWRRAAAKRRAKRR